MRRLQRFLLAAFSIAVLLCGSACEVLQGMKFGGSSLAPLASAGQRLAESSATPEPDEAEIGRHLAGTLVGVKKLSRNLPAQRYVNAVGRWLTLRTSRSTLNWRFGILQDDDVNAFAAPGGYVFVTQGLLNLLDSEAELAAVLSHEIAHVTYEHHLNAVRKGNLLGSAIDTSITVADAALGGKSSSGRREFVQRAVNAARTLYARGLDRQDEYQADGEALRLMTVSGYDPYALVAVMQKLEARASSDGRLALLLQTHPRPSDRIEALSKGLARLPTPLPQTTLADRFVRELRVAAALDHPG